jgi:hypothetical protein
MAEIADFFLFLLCTRLFSQLIEFFIYIFTYSECTPADERNAMADFVLELGCDRVNPFCRLATHGAAIRSGTFCSQMIEPMLLCNKYGIDSDPVYTEL